MGSIPHDEGLIPIATTIATDDLSTYYANKAATSDGVNMREAARNFVVAEEHIKEGEAYEDALRNANKALALFRELRNAIGETDSLRLIIHAYRLRAQRAQGSEAASAMQQAEDMARENAAAFRRLGERHRRGEAGMLLSLAEVLMTTKRKDAAKAAIEAQALCKQEGDKKMEATAVLVLCDIYLQQKKGQAAVKAALEARTLFAAAKDKSGEPKALHALALARSSVGEGVEAIAAAKQAHAVYQTLGSSKSATLELFNVARLCLDDGDTDEALAMVKQLKYTIQINLTVDSDGDWRGWDSVASSLEVSALIAAGKVQEASEAAEERLENLPLGSDTTDRLWGMRASAQAVLASGKADAAVKIVEDALQVCAAKGCDATWETGLTFLAAEMFSKAGNPAKAIAWGKKASDRFSEAGDKLGEVKAMELLAQEQMNSKDPVAALKISRRGRTLASKAQQQGLEGSMLLQGAKAFLQMGEEEDGMGAAQEAAYMFNEANDLRGEMEACKLVSAIYKENEEYEEADETARKAQGLARDLGDRLAEIEMLRWQSHLHAQFGRSKAALRAAKDAMRVGKNQAKKVQAETLLLVSQKYLEHLSSEASRQEEPAKLIMAKANLVLKPGVEAIGMAKAIEDKELTCLAYIIQGQIANNVFRYEEALTCHEEALVIAQEISDKQCEAAAYIMGAEARFQLGRMDLAVELAGKAQPLAKSVGDKNVLERCKRFISVSSGGGGGRGRGRRRVKIGTKKVKKMVKKQIGGGGGGGGVVVADVKSMAMNVLKELAEAENFGFDDPLMDSGLDSLAAVTFRDSLSKNTGTKLPGTLMFDHPTLGDVVNVIVEEMGGEAGGGGGEPQFEWVEEEVEESEYEEVSDDDAAPRRRRRRKIGTKKVKKMVPKPGSGGGGGGGVVVADVKSMAMNVLKELAEAENFGFDDPLMDSGLDSLAAVTFRDSLSKNTGTKLPGTLMFDHPTLGDVVNVIVEEMGGEAGGGGGEPEMMEIEVEESEYEDVSDDDDEPPPRAVAKIADAPAGAPAASAVAKPQGLAMEDVKALAMMSLKELTDGEETDFETPLMETGLDSLAAVSLRNELAKKTNMKLPGTLMFDHPTLGSIAEFIVEESTAALGN